MNTINQYSKKGKELIQNYWKSTNYRINDCYQRPSSAKLNAEDECIWQMVKEGGRGFKIISYSHFYFTCGWLVNNDLRIKTPSNSYIIKNILI